MPGWDVDDVGGRETMKKRLLHNGANTMQIIDVYISTIKVRALRSCDHSLRPSKPNTFVQALHTHFARSVVVGLCMLTTPPPRPVQALRAVDPTDVLLEAVARPIRAYLRARKDTVRCIVTSLTDENSGACHSALPVPLPASPHRCLFAY